MYLILGIETLWFYDIVNHGTSIIIFCLKISLWLTSFIWKYRGQQLCYQRVDQHVGIQGLMLKYLASASRVSSILPLSQMSQLPSE